MDSNHQGEISPMSPLSNLEDTPDVPSDESQDIDASKGKRTSKTKEVEELLTRSPHRDETSKLSREYVVALEKRLEMVESMLAKVNGGLPTSKNPAQLSPDASKLVEPGPAMSTKDTTDQSAIEASIAMKTEEKPVKISKESVPVPPTLTSGPGAGRRRRRLR
ncbi:hypothetical protein T440DRAFT_533107 [Plenodomus tracheiphilus IPT5]|uniref:Uncharacterized protein n=1 Tax=Plenodomus tracheiphilus IPT5 TaxID=1408161 RepID=A0A6A7B2W7_9PLEO|nr:hypothetical protein T440DRAFT_533107 [Plenodomus tracheiphilus IPT5]